MKRMKHALLILGCLCAVSLAIMVLSLLNTKANKETAFEPPVFDPAARKGTPTVSSGLGYSRLFQDGMEFAVWICGAPAIQNKSVVIYLTNEASNTALLKLRVMDETGKLLGETGLIQPGEYLQTVRIQEELAVGSPIHFKIMAYEPETYYSAGSLSLQTTVSAMP